MQVQWLILNSRCSLQMNVYIFALGFTVKGLTAMSIIKVYNVCTISVQNMNGAFMVNQARE